MIFSPSLYTATMARLFAEQGYLRKSAEIYRHLLAREPERDDLRAALSDLERRLSQQPAPTRKDIEMLLREWTEMLKQNHSKEHTEQI